MSQTISNLILDVLPRLQDAPKGISIYQAANSVLSLLYKKLLNRRSDLLASGDLDLVISAFGSSVTLPEDFVSVAEKPRAEDLYTDWMAGTIISYNSVTGTLVVNVTNFSGTDILSAWYIAVAPLPGEPSNVVGQSTTSLTPTSGPVSLTTQLGLSLIPGEFVYIIPNDLPSTLTPRIKHLQPEYLDEDEEHDSAWWYWYGYYGYAYEPPVNRPSRYKIVGDKIYVRPKPIINVKIKGRYFQKPTDFSSPTDVIPYSFFYEVFREGVVRIILKQIAIPDSDPDFVIFLNREIDTVITSRFKELPRRRTHRRDWL